MEISTQRTKQLLDQQETFSEDPRRKLLLFVRRRQSSAALGPRGGCEEQEDASHHFKVVYLFLSVKALLLLFMLCRFNRAYFHNKMHIYLFCL